MFYFTPDYVTCARMCENLWQEGEECLTDRSHLHTKTCTISYFDIFSICFGGI